MIHNYDYAIRSKLSQILVLTGLFINPNLKSELSYSDLDYMISQDRDRKKYANRFINRYIICKHNLDS